MKMFRKSAKGAARAAELNEEQIAPRSVLRAGSLLISMTVLAALAVWQAPAQQAPAPAPAPQPPQQQPATPQTAAQQPGQPAPMGTLTLQDASLTGVVDQLARQLKINIEIDPRVKGTI